MIYQDEITNDCTRCMVCDIDGAYKELSKNTPNKIFAGPEAYNILGRGGGGAVISVDSRVILTKVPLALEGNGVVNIFFEGDDGLICPIIVDYNEQPMSIRFYAYLDDGSYQPFETKINIIKVGDRPTNHLEGNLWIDYRSSPHYNYKYRYDDGVWCLIELLPKNL